MNANQKIVKALSIRQPWAWLIVNGFKDVENRGWRTRYRGRFLVHASKEMTFNDWIECLIFIDGVSSVSVHLPPAAELERGGILGEAELVDCVEESDSEWFVGRYGYVCRNAKVLPFRECKGALGFFEAGEAR